MCTVSENVSFLYVSLLVLRLKMCECKCQCVYVRANHQNCQVKFIEDSIYFLLCVQCTHPTVGVGTNDLCIRRSMMKSTEIAHNVSADGALHEKKRKK